MAGGRGKGEKATTDHSRLIVMFVVCILSCKIITYFLILNEGVKGVKTGRNNFIKTHLVSRIK